MNEQLLQFIWQFQYYNKQALTTSKGEALQILQQGSINKNQGPDFLNGKIKCATTTLVGSIELHVLASDWLKHQHSNDQHYNNVILHVVWQEDVQLPLQFPVLVLHDRVSKILLQQYQHLQSNQPFIPCSKQLQQVNDMVIFAWKQRLFVERLQQKTTAIQQQLQQQQPWETLFWQVLCKNFGGTTNKEAFEKIAQTISIQILAKHKNQLHQLEALLLGQAGLLQHSFEDDYPKMLQKEYQFLQHKYQLQPTHATVQWLRMRPANFPTIRLSQLAQIIYKNVHLFSQIMAADDLKKVYALFDVAANDYWLYHYRFDEPSVYKEKKLGKQMIHHLIINVVLPMLYVYGWYHNKPSFSDKAIEWALQLPAEKNSITKGFANLGISNTNALDSQALIQLKNNYCNHKHCLQCAIGNHILKKEY
ncbi:DUF2851 family protein [Ferruginibacter yonginensis]|uniref:DUF2851 family protein n=1 Tax=Ferruginibacter yonginensis TaxID=1310416 RepID=A0ABV8QQ41_9BACT